ncbi:MAG: hypothetical protein MIO93_12105 [ANME-2 cluster archaeon]|nr:hypothetical protein [ANME-2 cluster archaeon]
MSEYIWQQDSISVRTAEFAEVRREGEKWLCVLCGDCRESGKIGAF